MPGADRTQAHSLSSNDSAPCSADAPEAKDAATTQVEHDSKSENGEHTHRCSVIYVARQLGHDARLTLSRDGHVIDELDDEPRINAETAIQRMVIT